MSSIPSQEPITTTQSCSGINMFLFENTRKDQFKRDYGYDDQYYRETTLKVMNQASAMIDEAKKSNTVNKELFNKIFKLFCETRKKQATDLEAEDAECFGALREHLGDACFHYTSMVGRYGSFKKYMDHLLEKYADKLFDEGSAIHGDPKGSHIEITLVDNSTLEYYITHEVDYRYKNDINAIEHINEHKRVNVIFWE